MEYFWILVSTWPMLVPGLILPMADKGGQPDYASLISHMTLMEQTISGLQNSYQATQSRVTALETKLGEKEKELASNKHDLEEVRSRLSAAERDIAVLRANQDNYPNTAEFYQVKSDVASLRSMFNSSVIDIIGVEVMTHSRVIKSLASRQNISESKMTDAARQFELVESKMNATTKEISSLTHQMTASYLNISHLMALSASAATDVQALTRNLSQLTINVSKVLTQKDDVAFQVTQTASFTTGYTTLKFDTVRINNGGGYNSNTGIFTAPVKGTYLFWVDVDVDVDSKAADHEDFICIIKDDKCLIKAVSVNNPSDSGKSWSVASTMAVTNLVQGQTIHFQIGSSLSHIGGISESCYGGALLRADFD